MTEHQNCFWKGFLVRLFSTPYLVGKYKVCVCMCVFSKFLSDLQLVCFKLLLEGRKEGRMMGQEEFGDGVGNDGEEGDVSLLPSLPPLLCSHLQHISKRKNKKADLHVIFSPSTHPSIILVLLYQPQGILRKGWQQLHRHAG